MERTTVFTCADCKRTITHVSDMTTGYGVEPGTDAKICFECCGTRDHKAMLETGKATLYLTTEPDSDGPRFGRCKVANWPGTLSFTGRYRRGAHNMARYRYDTWFKVPGDDYLWHGVTYGDMTQICHCKRTRQR